MGGCLKIFSQLVSVVSDQSLLLCIFCGLPPHPTRWKTMWVDRHVPTIILKHLQNHAWVTEALNRPQKRPHMVLIGKFSQLYSLYPVRARASGRAIYPYHTQFKFIYTFIISQKLASVFGSWKFTRVVTVVTDAAIVTVVTVLTIVTFMIHMKVVTVNQ